MNHAEADQTDLVQYPYALGFHPEKIRNNDYWYFSPLKAETTLSFKVRKVFKQWYDHGAGKGGNLFDFALLYHHCQLHEVLKNLENQFSFHQHSSHSQKPSNAGEKGYIKVIDVREINALELAENLSKKRCRQTFAPHFLWR